MNSPDRGYPISVVDILSVHLAGLTVIVLIVRTMVTAVVGG